ncbi:hypothetical protein MG293_016331 [Ovis ammon polii]|uniref:Uncharacterized protein n=1 Tax=Ovis ammon polii TaxID=230172 RepID=A0AAD4TSB0_OVIAM|nr:hypothetical protein MG293_016331 [Ovis ammon polii]KAI4556131.1 hypothetical protein MJT46_014754 [Ovis ammon polii x Ovis aries]
MTTRPPGSRRCRRGKETETQKGGRTSARKLLWDQFPAPCPNFQLACLEKQLREGSFPLLDASIHLESGARPGAVFSGDADKPSHTQRKVMLSSLTQTLISTSTLVDFTISMTTQLQSPALRP